MIPGSLEAGLRLGHSRPRVQRTRNRRGRLRLWLRRRSRRTILQASVGVHFIHSGIGREVETDILVYGVSSRAIRIVETLDDFWSKCIATAGEVETCTFVEFGLVGGDLCFVPAEAFGADACQGLLVSVLNYVVSSCPISRREKWKDSILTSQPSTSFSPKSMYFCCFRTWPPSMKFPPSKQAR